MMNQDSSDTSDEELVIRPSPVRESRNAGRRTRNTTTRTRTRNSTTNDKPQQEESKPAPFILNDSSESSSEVEIKTVPKQQPKPVESPKTEQHVEEFVLPDDSDEDNNNKSEKSSENSTNKIDEENKQEDTIQGTFSTQQHEHETHDGEGKVVKKRKKILRSEYVQKHLSKPSTLYRVHRVKNTNITQRLIFQVFKKNECLLTAKGKSVVINMLRVQKGDESHLSATQFYATIKINGWLQKRFELFNGSGEQGEPKMVLDMNPGSASTTRTTTVVSIDDENLQKFFPIHSRDPIYNEQKGTWQLDFLGKFVLRSVKNAIIDGKNHSRLLTIRKTTQEDLELETTVEMDPLYILVFGVAAFIV